jgi:hypothetical protein
MKTRNILMIAAMSLLPAMSFAQQQCNMPVYIQLDEDFTNIPPAAYNMLNQKLNRLATNNGLTTSEGTFTPFVLTVHCDVIDKSNLAGPPMQTLYNLGLTFYMADTFTKKKFGTAYITVDGVGNNEIKSYINAFSRIGDNNAEIKGLINRGKANMLKYYDTEYKNIIKEAKRMETLNEFEKAVHLVLSIPVCSKGGDEASRYGLQLYNKYIDRMNLYLLNKAKALWAAGQTQETAFEVCEMLSKIDPAAACYGDATKLMTEVKAQVRKDIDLQMRDQYEDSVKLEKMRIEAARAVGVAYGKGQKNSTTNLMWMR